MRDLLTLFAPFIALALGIVVTAYAANPNNGA